jgi:glycosyltransferase involved in cell wall biosynthesis
MIMNTIKVSCIIAAYNERSRIGNVLRAVYKHPIIDEIIVVDDGSADDTTSFVLSNFPGIKVITHPKNKGKSFAIHTGLEESRGEFIVLIDADLLGLTAQNITDLINPVLENRADISISLRKNAPIFWRLIGLDYISGERTFHKNMLDEQYDNLSKLPGFGLEVFLNQIAIKNNYRIEVVPWPNVYSPEKFKKHGLKLGITGEIGMFVDIFKTVSFFEVIREIVKMTGLKVK